MQNGRSMSILELQDIVEEAEAHADKWDYSQDRVTFMSFLNEKYPKLTTEDIERALYISRL